jgi:hypothetical protein
VQGGLWATAYQPAPLGRPKRRHAAAVRQPRPLGRPQLRGAHRHRLAREVTVVLACFPLTRAVLSFAFVHRNPPYKSERVEAERQLGFA